MKITYKFLFFLCLCYLTACGQGQDVPVYDIGKNYVEISPTDTEEDIIEKAAHVVPSARQYEWQKLESIAFIHFGLNTFDDAGWTKRTPDFSLFNPKEIDFSQWVSVLKNAGMKMIIFTAKHHNGFCHWPSKYTDFDIAATPFQNGQGDLMRDLAKACKADGMKLGVYLSPWDLHEETYGTEAYNIYFRNQLRELLTNYGDIAEVWFDGANGEGPYGRQQTYDWDSYYQLIRKLQPNALIAIMGPDVRWVGTESGYGRSTEWSVLPACFSEQEDIAAESQQADKHGAFIPRNLSHDDIGSRKLILKAKSLVWYPAETDVSVRPSWHYSEHEDELVKSPEKLVDIYFNSVGMNAVLLLNVGPDKRGLIHHTDIESLEGMKYILDNTFDENLIADARMTAIGASSNTNLDNLSDSDNETYCSPKDRNSTLVIVIDMLEEKSFDVLMLQENIKEGQRIEQFKIEFHDGQEWVSFSNGTTIGYKRLLRFPEVHAAKIRVSVTKSRSIPQLSTVELYKMPPGIIFNPPSSSFRDTMVVTLNSDTRGSKIYYTLDGSSPDENSKIYTHPVSINSDVTINAIAISPKGKKSIGKTECYNKIERSVKYNTAYSDKYPGDKVFTLVNNRKGSSIFNDGKWQGFYQNDLDVLIDLQKEKNINLVSTSFLNDVKSYIFAPEYVEYSFSKDGRNYYNEITLGNDVLPENSRQGIRIFETTIKNTLARYIRVYAKNVGICPEWHIGAGEKAWLFVDEVSVK